MAAPKGNQFAVGNNGGRPRKYETAEELLQAMQEYFTYLEGEFHMEEITEGKGKEAKTIQQKVWDRYPEDPTITGLALFLGFESRQSLFDYGKKDEFSYIIKRATSLVENSYEKKLSASSPTGAIFALKNMGWKDKSETEVSGTGMPINLIFKPTPGCEPIKDGG